MNSSINLFFGLLISNWQSYMTDALDQVSTILKETFAHAAKEYKKKPILDGS